MVRNEETNFYTKNKLYIDCGSEEKELISDYSKMVRYLEENYLKIGLKFESYLYSGSRHTESDWAKRIHIPLKYLFGKMI